MLDALKRLFARPEMPADAREAFARARTPDELLEALDAVCTTNEVELRGIELAIGRLEATEQLEIERVRDDDVSPRQKKIALQRIQRLRRDIKTQDDKIDIHTKNVNLLQNLMAKIQLIQSMSLQGVDAAQIDAIVLGFQENLERYQDVMEAGLAGESADPSFLSTKDQADLESLESELLAARDSHEQAESDLVAAVADLEDFDAEPRELESALSDSDREELRQLEAEILGRDAAAVEPSTPDSAEPETKSESEPPETPESDDELA